MLVLADVILGVGWGFVEGLCDRSRGVELVDAFCLVVENGEAFFFFDSACLFCSIARWEWVRWHVVFFLRR